MARWNAEFGQWALMVEETKTTSSSNTSITSLLGHPSWDASGTPCQILSSAFDDVLKISATILRR